MAIAISFKIEKYASCSAPVMEGSPFSVRSYNRDISSAMLLICSSMRIISWAVFKFKVGSIERYSLRNMASTFLATSLPDLKASSNSSDRPCLSCADEEITIDFSIIGLTDSAASEGFN